MWRLEHAPQHPLPDIDRFVALVNARADFFDPATPIVVARAPGRLDLMGGIADYSGALVLQLPLGAATLVAAQPTDEPQLTALSATAAEIGAESLTMIALGELTPSAGPLSYDAAHRLLTAHPRRSWLAYVAGVLVVLHRERGLRPERGLRLLIDSAVPAGKGISSSAAIEVAVMRALDALYGLRIDGRELALLCQKVENLVVGAPCGVMDQMTSACGEQSTLLALLCQPAEIQSAVALPPDVAVWGIDSGIRHAVSGADYGSVRVAAFMGYRMIAELAGLPVTPHGDQVAVDDSLWQGYLANLPPSLWETTYRDQLPVALDGAAFLARYGGTTDAVTRIDPARTYAVRQATAHPIYEHHRVRLFRSLLGSQPLGDEQLALLGELMYQSHASYSACGLGTGGTDRLVALVRERGPAAGLYGAKITGGGSGGTVAVLGQASAATTVQAIAAQYERETGHPALIFSGSSPGAVQFGSLRLVQSYSRGQGSGAGDQE